MLLFKDCRCLKEAFFQHFPTFFTTFQRSNTFQQSKNDKCALFSFGLVDSTVKYVILCHTHTVLLLLIRYGRRTRTAKQSKEEKKNTRFKPKDQERKPIVKCSGSGSSGARAPKCIPKHLRVILNNAKNVAPRIIIVATVRKREN